MQTRYVVDTTIIVSWLLNPDKLTGKIVRSLELELFTPYKTISELWKHQKEWIRRRPTFDLQQFTDSIGYYVTIEMLAQDSEEMKEAKAIMEQIDPDDAEFVALALKLKATIWSHDKHFLKQDRIGVVTSRDILKRSAELPTLWEALNEEWFRQRSEPSSLPSGMDTNERERRLQILTKWWREQIG